MKSISWGHRRPVLRTMCRCAITLIALVLLRIGAATAANVQPATTNVIAPAPDPDAIVILPLEDGAGTNAEDVSGKGNDGTLIGGAAFEENTGDGSNFAVRFDGVDDYIDLGTVDVNGSGLTLAVWFHAESFPGPSSDPRLISKASGSSANAHVFMLSAIQSGGSVRLRARVRVGGNTTTLIADSGVLQTGQWHHGGLTHDGTTLRLYLDGAEVGSTPLAGLVDTDPAMSVAVGGQPTGLDPRFFDGLLDDVRILERALSAAEMAALAGGNQQPTALADDYTTAEDTAIIVIASLGVLANDFDLDLDSLQALIEDGVSNGVVNLNGDGSFDYTPSADFNGVDTFTYHAFDGSTNSNLATVTLTVTPVGDSPVATDDGYQTEPNTMLAVSPANGVLSNDVDVDTDPLRAVLVHNASNGALSLRADGSFDYVPGVDFFGIDSFTYRASDEGPQGKPGDDHPMDEPRLTSGAGASASLATVTIIVALPPLATDDGYVTGEDTTLVVPANEGVLANDEDNVAPDDLTAVLLTNPTRGTLTFFAADGAFTYVPDPDSSGVDSFTYKTVDGSTGTVDTASVTVTINPVNDPPTSANDNYQTPQNAPLVVSALSGVLANDADVENDPLQTVLVDNVNDGFLNLNADGSFDYTPSLDFIGIDGFSYRADDLNMTSDLATVTINVTGSDADAVVILPLDDGAGTSAGDVSGNGNDGTLAGGALFESDTGDGSAWAVRFDGVDDYIDLGNLDVTGGGLTLAAWFKATTFPGEKKDPRLISKATGTGLNQHVFMLSTIDVSGVVQLRGRVRVGGATTTLIATGGGLQTGQWRHAALTHDGVMMRLYLDGFEVGAAPLPGTVDVDPSVPVAVGGQPPISEPRYFDGLIDDVRILQRALSASEIAAIRGPTPPPIIDVWYGDDQSFGDKGNPQTLIQVLGRVRQTAPLTDLSYRFNGGASQPLPAGPDGFRLVSWGDFAVELDNSSLNPGANTVEITAVDAAANQAAKTVTVNYTEGLEWSMPDTLDWSSANVIADEGQVVDGLWQLGGIGVRTVSDAIGYDRLIVAGNYTWVPDYEVVGSLIVHEILNGGSAGFAIGWQGHTGPLDPRLGHPYEAIGWINWLGNLQMLRNGDGTQAQTFVGLTLGTEYKLRVRSETLGGGQSNVRVKWWPASSSEPGTWDLNENVSTVNGSVLLVAHRVDVTFGEAIIQPLTASAAAADHRKVVDARPPPAVLTVLQNFPNPFSATTEIEYGLPSPSDVRIEVYTVAGERVFEHYVSPRPGWHRLSFDGSKLAAGVYFFKMSTVHGRITRKIVIMR